MPVPVNDSGLGATDLDIPGDDFQAATASKTRYIATNNRLYAMHKNADGVAYFGIVRHSDIEAVLFPRGSAMSIQTQLSLQPCICLEFWERAIVTTM